eukprot:1353969-Prymnesium_polylepis.1
MQGASPATHTPSEPEAHARARRGTHTRPTGSADVVPCTTARCGPGRGVVRARPRRVPRT